MPTLSNATNLTEFNRAVASAEKALCKLDPNLKQLISQGPAFDSTPFNKEPFEALVHAIIAQQLSVSSARAIRQRVSALVEKNAPDARAFNLLSHTDLRSAGLSQAKASTVERLISFALDDTNQFDTFYTLPDAVVKSRLCEIKGIGPWTVDIFLMFGLKRLDIFAKGDLGLRKAIQKLYKLDKLPQPNECEAIAQQWQPYRTIASWYLWRTVD